MLSLEKTRVDEVNRFLTLDFNRTSEFQTLVDLAAKLCQMPVAIIALLGENHNYLKVRSGVDFEVMPRETSFCQHAIKQDGVFVIPDATKDPRFKNSPLVLADPKIRFYAGAPLTLSNGLKLGSLCIFDLKPNQLTDLQENVLELLSRQATSFMEVELSRMELRKEIGEKEEKNQALLKIAQLQSHQIRQPLTSIMGLVNLIRDGHQEVDEDWLSLFESATENFDSIIQTIVAETFAAKDLKAIRFHKMVEEIQDCAILLLDENGYIENWNSGAKKIKGYSHKEAIGKHFSIFYTDHDKNSNRPEKLIAEAEKNGVARDEGWRVRKNGDKFWGSIVITAIHDGKNQVIGFTKLTRDLTDIMDVQDSLKASDGLYQHLAQQTNKVARVGGWELDLIKNELTWSSITKEIHGVDHEYVPQLDRAINFYKEGFSRKKISELVALAVSEGKSWDVSLQIVTRQGKELWVRSTGSSNYKDGNCSKVYGTFQDIDLLKKAEINYSAKRNSIDFDATPELCIITTDLDGLIVTYNSGAQKMLGYQPEEIIKKVNLCAFFNDKEIVSSKQSLAVNPNYYIEPFNTFTKEIKALGGKMKNFTFFGNDGIKKERVLLFTPVKNNYGNNVGYMCLIN